MWLHRAAAADACGGRWRPPRCSAVGCGGVWYLRNLFEHGSPLWPFVETPWGTPLPPRDGVGQRQLRAHSPRETIEVVGDLYLSRFLGGIVLLAGRPASRRCSRGAAALCWIASAAAVVSFLIWARAPFTGVPPVEVRIPEGVFSTTRYLAPAVAAAIVALALAGSGRGWRARVAQLLLAAGLGIELVQAFRLGFPAMPSPLTPLAGAVARALAAVVGRRCSRGAPASRPRLGARPALVAAALAVGALLAVPASGYLDAATPQRGVFASGLSGWMARQPDDARPVASAPLVVAPARRRPPAPPAGRRSPAARRLRGAARAARGRATWCSTSARRPTPT